LVKIKVGTENIIKIIDPWMKRLPSIVLDQLSQNNPHSNIELLSRSIKDQYKEGSCSLCTFSRLYNLFENINDFENLTLDILTDSSNKMLNDFNAYLTSYVYRKSIGY